MPDEWSQFLSGLAASPAMQYVVTFSVIFAVLGMVALLVRRMFGKKRTEEVRGLERGRQPRLGIVDVYELDQQRSLILLRRDNVEHLLLVGGPNDVVIESGIQRMRSVNPEATAAPRLDASSEPAGEKLAAVRVGQGDALFPPSLPLPKMASSAPAIQEVRPPGQETRKDEGTKDVEEIVVGPRPSDPIRGRRTAPPVKAPSVDTPSRGRRDEPAPGPSLAKETQPAVATEQRRLNPGILSDMARQLETALGLPPAEAHDKPTQSPGEAVGGEPALTAALSTTATAKVVPVATVPAQGAPKGDDKAGGRSFDAPAMMKGKPNPKPEGAPAQEPVKVDLSAEGAGKAAASEINPFSVEEIEAEFARLLGRPLGKHG